MIRAALRSLLARKLRLLMSTFAIVLGVAFVAGSLIFSDTLHRSFTALFASTVGDVVVRPVGGTTARGAPSTQTLPARLVEELAGVPGAARADGNVQAFGVFVVGADGKVVGGLGPPALAGNWSDAPAGRGLEGLTLAEGRVPRGPGEVVLDARTADRAGYGVGDTVELVTPTERLDVEATLVGISDFAEGGSLNGATLVEFETATAQDLFVGGEDAYHDIWVTAEPGVSQEELADRVRPVLPDGVEAVTGDDAAEESASDLLEAVSFFTTFLLVFAGIALVVGSFLIVNTFAVLVAQRSRELALLRALGASKRQVTWSVQLEALVLGLAGSTVGLGLGVLLAMGIRAVTARFGLDLSGQSLVFSWRTVFAAYVVGVLVTMAAAWLPARRTARIAPVQALRDDVALPEGSLRRRVLLGAGLVVAGLTSLAVGLLADVPRAGWLVGSGVLAVLLGTASASPVLSRPLLVAARAGFGRAFGSIGHLAGQNGLRNPRRTTATASALMIGLALACTMAIVGDSAKATVDRSVEESFVGDYVVSSAFGQEFSPAVADRMERVDGVASVARERFAFARVGEDDQGIAAAAPGDLDDLGITLVDGSATDLRDRTVVLERSWAEDEGLRTGDTVEVGLPTGEQEWEVVGLYEDNPLVFFPLLTTLGSLVEGGFPERDNYVVVHAEPGAAGLGERLEEVVAESPVVTVKDQAGFAAEQRAPIDQLVLMVFALLGLALVIAVLGIVNTLALSVVERTREVGLLRAVGVSRGQLRWMITLESVVIALLGAVLGVVLGVFFGVALMYSLREEGLEVISVPAGQLAVFLVLALLIGVLAALLPARRAARLDVLRAIATE